MNKYIKSIFIFTMVLALPLGAKAKTSMAFGVDISGLSHNNLPGKSVYQKGALYAKVKAVLDDYYKGDYQAGAPGWYRVDDFLSWLKGAEEGLLKSTLILNEREEGVESLSLKTDPLDKKIFYYYLGVRYINSLYPRFKSDRPVVFKHSRYITYPPSACADDSCQLGPGPECDMAGKDCFAVGESELGSPAAHFINLGIHEGTHDMGRYKDGDESFDETATFYTGRRHALPEKYQPGLFPLGARDTILRAKAGVPTGDIMTEYVDYFTGPLSWAEVSANPFVQGFSKEETNLRFFLAHAAIETGGPYFTSSRSGSIPAGMPIKKYFSRNKVLNGTYAEIFNPAACPGLACAILKETSADGAHEIVIAKQREGGFFFAEYSLSRVSAPEYVNAWHINNPAAGAQALAFLEELIDYTNKNLNADDIKSHFYAGELGSVRFFFSGHGLYKANTQASAGAAAMIDAIAPQIVQFITDYYKSHNIRPPAMPPGYL